ncbi:hypothetical protein LIER_21091 [Lithospermum erythrorhizon]|uniref:Uncharacterized protein n=1 Tax=Lithospermum erythrorhizon TaxID=34254 RepID=A0AAV3QRE6_LITER
MVTFETTTGSEFSTLRMVGPKEDKVTTLIVYTSLYKGHSIPTPKLERGRSWSSTQEKAIYLEGPDKDSPDPPHGFHFLSSMMSAGRMQWRGSLSIRGNFEYIHGYWNRRRTCFCESWCPSTNSLTIPQGELSIYLWDLLELGGLLVTSRLFDEVVPTTECVAPTLDSDARLPRSYQFLLLAYHCLASHSPDGTVCLRAWIGLWNYSLRTYVGHETADRSTTKIAPAFVCPRGPTILQHRSWDSRDRYPFEVLEVDADLVEEVYCAAFLSC